VKEMGIKENPNWEEYLKEEYPDREIIKREPMPGTRPGRIPDYREVTINDPETSSESEGGSPSGE
jgi:hypothetical protein